MGRHNFRCPGIPGGLHNYAALSFLTRHKNLLSRPRQRSKTLRRPMESTWNIRAFGWELLCACGPPDLQDALPVPMSWPAWHFVTDGTGSPAASTRRRDCSALVSWEGPGGRHLGWIMPSRWPFASGLQRGPPTACLTRSPGCLCVALRARHG